MTLLVDIRINNNPEWITYKNNPSPNTLSEFINTCRKQGTEEIILYSLYIAYVNTGNWKIAQHLSLLLEEQKQSTYADYFVYKALQESKGDVSARLLSAKLLWLRRLPLAVINETTIIRHQIKKIKDKNRRFIVCVFHSILPPVPTNLPPIPILFCHPPSERKRRRHFYYI